MPGEPVRIAMWSGPRNISTALMRAFENRTDCAVVDEPFYGYYLKTTGLDHPGAAEIVAAMDCSAASVAATLTGPVPDGRAVWYQKHMTHHMLDEVDLSFARGMVNCVLLRDPARIIASYARVRPDFDLTDIGLPQQLRIARELEALTGAPPFVLHSEQVLADPRAALSALCAHAGINMTDAMLSWPAGQRSSDGVWAPHWYAAVERSTGFGAPPGEAPVVPERYRELLDDARQIYKTLAG